MSEDGHDDGDSRVRELLRLNAALDDQVRHLVRTEQKLFLSQRELGRQIARLDALNQFAIDVAGHASPERILERAADVLFSLFPFDQALAFVVRDGLALVPSVVRAVPGREPPESRARDACATVLGALPEDREPRFGTADELRRASSISPLLDCVDAAFARDDPSTDATVRAWTLVLPLSRRGTPGSELEGVLVFRTRGGPLSFHEELPNAKDVAFLGLFARQIAAAVTSSRLLRDLQLSYERLADAQRERVERERLAALGELAAVVAHEVRNPLGAISNAVSVLARLVPAEGDARGMIAIVREEAGRLNQIVSDLIDFARPHTPAPKRESIATIAETAIESVRVRFPESHVTLTTEGDASAAWVDGRMIRQALINLIVNAVLASPDGEPIAVRVAGGDSDGVRIEVEDHGPGVPAALAQRVFEPFFTTRPSGTGLGLSVVRRAAEAHGGSVSLHDAPNGGAVFVIHLPANAGE
ncbi:sensor histidine kinase [Sandaracinus amylolyticus]|uniref:sensor histidine kinase n=1 Tax=Sandaracinus amylolyticus TaxID=927083 RepID=UPI001F17C971|nr:sensor histidine kinase [Sandaracinus amylolyticus]UJR78886.1 Flagellar sensor histidine kinase FleS [Sandaracinus amylolyticus]